MLQTQKDFILQDLIPFILREEGRWFGMTHWAHRADPHLGLEIDGELREFPDCGTVCCIGGSISALARLKVAAGLMTIEDVVDVAKVIGLSFDQGMRLFMNWRDAFEVEGWPEPYRQRFADAYGPLAHAEVACDLLRAIVRTEGRILETGVDEPEILPSFVVEKQEELEFAHAD